MKPLSSESPIEHARRRGYEHGVQNLHYSVKTYTNSAEIAAWVDGWRHGYGALTHSDEILRQLEIGRQPRKPPGIARHSLAF